MCAINIFMSRDCRLAKDILSKLFHNLSLQALRKKKFNVELKFNNITKIMKEIDRNSQNKALKDKKRK